MNDDIIEYNWNCTNCETTGILGRHLNCPSCGASVPNNDCYYEPENAPTITDPDQLRDALAGDNWKCEFCEGGARNLDGSCSHCGGERIQPKKNRSYDIDEDSDLPIDDCPAPPYRKENNGQIVLGAICGAGILGACSLIWAFSTHDVSGQISDRTWTRSVTVENWAETTTSGWREANHLREVSHSNPPAEFAGMENIRNCVTQQRTTRQVVSGSHQVCSDAEQINDGGEILDLFISPSFASSFHNGYGTRSHSSPSRSNSYHSSPSSSHSYSPPKPHVPVCHSVTDYRSVPVYDDRCSYDTWAWSDGQTMTLTGTDDPRWPVVALGNLQKLRMAETYSITVAYGNNVTSQSLDSVSFGSWKVGEVAVVSVDHFGIVHNVRLK